MSSLPPVKQYISASGPRVYRIACSVFPNLSGRVYLVLDAGPPTLVDAGAVHGQSVRDLLAGFDAIRREFQMPVALADVKRIVITHGHLDHIGGLAELVDGPFPAACGPRTPTPRRSAAGLRLLSGATAKRRGRSAH